MYISILRTFVILVAAVSAVPTTDQDQNKQPKCSTETYNVPCVCPKGTTFRNLTTFGVLGAPAIEVQRVMGNFFDSDWQGVPPPIRTTGDKDKVGATRTYNFTVGSNDSFLFSEVLTALDKEADGSFTFGFAQTEKPAVVKVPQSGGAEFHGEWSIILAQQTVVANETALSFNNWRCDVGVPYPAAAGHELSLITVSSILKQKGVLTGVDIAPFTILYTERND